MADDVLSGGSARLFRSGYFYAATHYRLPDGKVTSAGAVSAKPMFGEYVVSVDGKMIGSVCDNQLFVKPTTSGCVHTAPASDAPPYPGAIPQVLIETDRWDNAEWLGELLRLTAAKLSVPKPRKSMRRT